MSDQMSLFAEPEVTPEPFRVEIVPRDYQRHAISESFRQFEAVDGAMCRQPTGTGKTITGCMVAQEWLSRGDDRYVMILAHERQLIWQFAEEVEDVLGIKPGIEMADREVKQWAIPRITVASRATLQERTKQDEDGREQTVSRLFKFDPALNWLVIWDEAHKHAYALSSVKHIVDHFAQNPNSKRLGLTATPERTDKRSLERMFPGIAIDYRMYDLNGGPAAVSDGWCVPYDQRFIVVEGVDFKNLREVAGDFRDDELEEILSTQEQLAKLCVPLLELVEKRRTIVFNPGVDMAKSVARYLNGQAGKVIAKSLDGSIPERERKRVYAQHQAGQFQFLSVCGLCREGYNDPGIQAVAVFRPTKSRALAEQMKGRGCRPLRGVLNGLETPEERRAAIAASDKPNCMIVDLVGVTGLADCASTAHIYANSKSDEVLALANKKAIEKSQQGQAVDMAEEIEAAQHEVDEKKRERERKAQAEADRRAKLRADVKYKQHQVNSGHGKTGTAKFKDVSGYFVLKFGKYKGQRLMDVDLGYIRWAASNLQGDWIRHAFQCELRRREKAAG